MALGRRRKRWPGKPAAPEAGEPQEPSQSQQVQGVHGLYDPRAGAYGEDDPGGGEPDPATGIRQWYNEPIERPEPRRRIEWADILDEWDALELDLHDRFGVDVEDAALLAARSWRWLESRIVDVVRSGTRTAPRLAQLVESVE